MNSMETTLFYCDVNLNEDNNHETNDLIDNKNKSDLTNRINKKNFSNEKITTNIDNNYFEIENCDYDIENNLR